MQILFGSCFMRDRRVVLRNIPLPPAFLCLLYDGTERRMRADAILYRLLQTLLISIRTEAEHDGEVVDDLPRHLKLLIQEIKLLILKGKDRVIPFILNRSLCLGKRPVYIPHGTLPVYHLYRKLFYSRSRYKAYRRKGIPAQQEEIIVCAYRMIRYVQYLGKQLTESFLPAALRLFVWSKQKTVVRLRKCPLIYLAVFIQRYPVYRDIAGGDHIYGQHILKLRSHICCIQT